MKKPVLFLLILLSAYSSNSQDFSADSIPVRLKYIQAAQQNNANKIVWSVVCLLDFAKFDIQRSQDGVSYTSISQFEADRARCLSPFEYEDRNSTGRSFYRVRVGDLDGRFYTSKTIIVYGKEKGFEITAISPSIVNSKTNLSVSSSSANRAELLIADQNGKIVSRRIYNLQTGNNDIVLDAATLHKGNYFLTIINANGQKRTVRFVKQ
jgi:hypothetical protein